MSHTTNESDDFVFSKDQTESPLAEDGCSNGNGNGGIVLKKGPWTTAEDAILIDYVKKHGEGNWNAVQKNSGLSRCGKSCRLRWANHLRPNLKKGAFTQEEEQLIIELHAKMGNKWARMATYLHGRTDNEIKNYWNTRIKRRQRAGLPLYPPEVSLQAMQENQWGLNIGEINTGDRGPHDFLQHNSFEIPDVVFDSLKANQGYYPYAPQLPDASQTGYLLKGLGSSQYNGFMMHRQKRLRESETSVLGYGGGIKDGFPLFDQFSFQFENENQGCHTLANGDFSASGSCSGPVKLELPSLQYPENDLSIWGTAPSPFLETVGNFIQSPPPVESSPQNSGLLDALIYQSSGKNHYSDKSSNSSTVTPGELAETSGLNNVYDTEWEEYGDPIAPLGQNATSLFSTPCGSSLEEAHPSDTFNGCNVKLELDDRAWSPERDENGIQLDNTHPDALISADWLGPGSEFIKDQSVMTNDVATLFGDDLSSDDKPMPVGSSEQNQGWGLGSCAWNVMPGVCQISELP